MRSALHAKWATPRAARITLRAKWTAPRAARVALRKRLARCGALLALASAGAACTTEEFLHQASIPGTSTIATVVSVGERFGYLDAVVPTGGVSYRYFFPDTPACRQLLVQNAELRWTAFGVFGRLRRVDDPAEDEEQATTCEPVGVLSLAEWRNRFPRQRTRSIVPRAQASFEIVARDEDSILLRGRFPLIGQIRFTGGERVLALVPRDERCEQVAEAGVASMEFRNAGPLVFTLLTPDGPCSIEGFIQATGEHA